MKVSVLLTISLLVLGIFTVIVPSTLAQPCENSGHSILGKGKQIFKQSNRCVIIENNNIPTTCPPGSILENGICVPTSGSAPIAVPTVSSSSTVVGNTLVTLNGLGSFATTNGATIVSYYWVQTSGSPTVSLTGANTATATFQAPIVINQVSLVFSLTVTDSLGHVSSPVSVTVTVTPS